MTVISILRSDRRGDESYKDPVKGVDELAFTNF